MGVLFKHTITYGWTDYKNKQIDFFDIGYQMFMWLLHLLAAIYETVKVCMTNEFSYCIFC